MIQLPAGSVYDEGYRKALVSAVGEDGAWLILSIDHYGWRARYDVISTLLQGPRPVHRHHARHLQSIIDLEVQSAMYASAEQLARLSRAIIRTADGGDFFAVYVASFGIGELGSPKIDQETLEVALGIPNSDELVLALEGVTDVRLSREEARVVVDRVRTLLSEIAGNLSELGQLVERHDLSGTEAPVDVGHSLRTVDNAYRHGMRILLHDVLPAPRAFGTAMVGVADPLSEFAIDLYQSDTEPKFATIDARPERTDAHLEGLRVMAIRLRQLARVFVASVADHPELVVTLFDIELPGADESLITD